MSHGLSNVFFVMALRFSCLKLYLLAARTRLHHNHHSQIAKSTGDTALDSAILLLVQVGLEGHEAPAAQVGSRCVRRAVWVHRNSLLELGKTGAAGAHVVHRFL